jgi:hypothetical protein
MAEFYILDGHTPTPVDVRTWPDAEAGHRRAVDLARRDNQEPTMSHRLAARIVNAVLDNLQDRRGFEAMDDFDPDVQQKVERELVALVTDVIRQDAEDAIVAAKGPE